MKIIKNNAYAALIVLVIFAMLFIGMYVMMDPFARIYSKFTNNSAYIGYVTEDTCKDAHGYWSGTECTQLPTRATQSMAKIRYTWLVAPFILVFGLIIWYFSVSTKKDPMYFNRGP